MKHTLESCMASAAQFTTKNDWKRGDNTSYQSARHNGWFDQCCAHMVKGKAGPKFGQRTYSSDQWIEKARAVHGERYDYSQVVYSDSYGKVKVGCSIHGVFEQGASSHLLGIGCPKCGLEKQVAARTGRKTNEPAANRSNLEAFIAAAREVHGDRYDYSRGVYTGNKVKIEIVCPEHGPFFQKPNGHLDGKGCALCFAVGPSRVETEMFDFIKALCPDAEQSVLGLLSGRHELDIVVPSKKVAVEFNGLIWHSSKYGKPRDYHQRKTNEAAAAGYRLIHVWADEWRDKRAWCEAFLRMQLVGPDRKFYARQCCFEPITVQDANAFHDAYHLQGRKGGESIGVFSPDRELLAVASVMGGELARWTVKFGVVIAGGLSKVIRMFGRSLISYCDTAKHTGNGYIAAGFKLDPKSYLTYYYTDSMDRHNRVGFQKHKLSQIPGAKGETEKELAASLGFYQIGGCEQLRFTYNP